MGQVLHGSATTTEAVRRAIQNSQKSLNTLYSVGAADQPVHIGQQVDVFIEAGK
jgi:hypothetical protein